MESRLMFLMLFTVATVCGQSHNNNLITRRSSLPGNSRHLGMHSGVNTTIDKHPYQGYIVRYGSSKVHCAMSIISPRWGMASAYCLSGQSNKTMYVVVGTTNGKNGTRVEVAQIILHPKCCQRTCNYDIGVIEFKTTLTFCDKIKALLLPKNCNRTNPLLNVAGWGQTSNGNTELSFKEGNMKWLTQKSCKNHYAGFGLQWSRSMGCAYNKGKTTLCEGDWSDPLVTIIKVNGTTQFIGQHIFCAVAARGICTPDAYPVINAILCVLVEWITKITGVKPYEE